LHCHQEKWISWYFLNMNFSSWHFTYATYLLCITFSHWQLNCAERSQIIKLVLFTNLNVNILLSCHWNFTSKSETKKRNKTNNNDDFCEMFVSVLFHSFLYFEKTIFVCLSVRKKWMILIIYNEKSALQRMCINLLYNTLSKTSVRFKLNIEIMHFKFAFETVMTHKINSFSAVRVNYCLCILI